MNIAGHPVGLERRLFLIAGPCVIETADHALTVAEKLRTIADRLGLFLIYKSSFDKANRTSAQSPRGPGIDEGLRILEMIKAETGLPVLTDVHECWQVAPTAEVVDVLQIPAFLSRQTDLITAAAQSGRAVNIKKGQFMSPAEAVKVAEKAVAARTAPDGPAIMLCDRGTTFGYHDLVVDMRGLGTMRQSRLPVVFDASHAVQRPGGLGNTSGGDRAQIPLLSRAAVAAGVSGLFIETHPDPANALSDAATVWPLDQLEPLLIDLIKIDALVKDNDMVRRGAGDEPA